jgi:putative DNA primase/helicase
MPDEFKKSFHQQVAERLIEQLKHGTAPWQKPWEPGEPASMLPMNPTTGKRYRGINAIQLMSQGRADQRWMTYKQASAVGAQVHQGAKGTPIQYWLFSEEQTKTDANGKPVLDAKGEPVKEHVRLERPEVFFATVFNAEQIDGLPPIQRKTQNWNAVERAEQILKASGVVIHHGEQNRAFYRPTTDSIHLPGKGQFATADKYYAIALHELGHATGHESRLNRDLAHPFGSEGYAKEELRAEIASMILGDELGIGHDPGQHAAYVGSWIKALQDDPLEVFRAAADAEKIQTYVLGLEQQVREQTTQQSHAIDVATAVDRPAGIDPHSQSQEGTIMMNDDASREPAQSTQSAKTYIAVPFKEKEEAKGLGARWDRGEQSWYVPAGVDPAPFAKWPNAATAEPPRAQTPKQETEDRVYLAVPYGDRVTAKAAGAEWDKAAKSWYAGPKANMEKLKRWLPDNVPNQQAPAMTPQEEFADALRSAGFVVTGDHPIMDGKKHRVAVEGGKKGATDGFYIGFVDGHPAGRIVNNKTGIDITWKAKGYSLPPEARAKLMAETAAKLQARAVDQDRLHERTAEWVGKYMTKLVPVEQPTQYMRAKGIAPQPGVFTDPDARKTYIPATDADGKQWTIQSIGEDGAKRFTKNSRKQGCFHAIGGIAAIANAPALVIAEGYATAVSLSTALGFATVAAFDAGNLTPVAKALRAKFPDKPIIIAGDDDQGLEASQGLNPGKTKAVEAARAVAGTAMFPLFAPAEQAANPKGFTDFNDLATKSVLGRDGLERQLRDVMDDAMKQHRVSIAQEEVQKRAQRRYREPQAARR